MAETIIKEFTNNATGVVARLLQGWDGDEPLYYAAQLKTGLRLESAHPDAGVISAQVFGPALKNYPLAHEAFAKLVQTNI